MSHFQKNRMWNYIQILYIKHQSISKANINMAFSFLYVAHSTNSHTICHRRRLIWLLVQILAVWIHTYLAHTLYCLSIFLFLSLFLRSLSTCVRVSVYLCISLSLTFGCSRCSCCCRGGSCFRLGRGRLDRGCCGRFFSWAGFVCGGWARGDGSRLLSGCATRIELLLCIAGYTAQFVKQHFFQ